MPGGIWTTQNKVRPGVYINFEGEPSSVGSIGESGILAVPAQLSWGQEGLITLEASTFLQESLTKLGYHPTDSRIRKVSKALSHAAKILIYRLSGTGAEKASVTLATVLTATAKYVGVRGNDLKIAIETNVDDETKFDVITYLESEEMDVQTVATAEELTSNDFIDFSGTGALSTAAATSLTGGADATVDSGSYTEALNAFEIEDFNVLGLPTDDTEIKDVTASYVSRLRDEGKKVQVVVQGYVADHEGVINLKNSVVISNGSTVALSDMVWEIAAMEAGANVNESLTYRAIPDAVDVSPKFTNSEIEQALQDGEMVLTAFNGGAVIEQDINSFTSFTPTKGYMFSKNRVIRVLDTINNDFVDIFSEYFIGKVNNDRDGRNLFKAECINYLEELQEIGAIQNFDAQTDVVVEAGEQLDSVYAEIYVQPVDSMEKFYIRVIARENDVSVNVGGAA